MDQFNRFVGLVRRCVDDYGMIESGDAIAVGISGGKDSLLLLSALHQLRRYYPKPFTLHALTVDAGFEGMDFEPVSRWCRALDVPYTIIKTDIREIVFDIRREPNPCSLCAKLRKGALNTAAKELGCGKLALGHHYDDAVNTFMMSLVFEGRLSCFRPVTYLDRSGITQLRPMLYAEERRIAELAASLSLPVVRATCPMDTDSKRREIQRLVSNLEQTYPDLKEKIFGAMQRLPLPGWERKENDLRGGNFPV